MHRWRGSIEMTSSSSAKRIGENNNTNTNTNNNNNNNERSNRDGLRGWLNPIKYGWERVSYLFQRLTGIFLLVYFIGHVYETSSLVNGPDAWAAMLEMTQTVGGHLFLILVIGASTFHSVNGIRLIFTHSGQIGRA